MEDDIKITVTHTGIQKTGSKTTLTATGNPWQLLFDSLGLIVWDSFPMIF